MNDRTKKSVMGVERSVGSVVLSLMPEITFTYSMFTSLFETAAMFNTDIWHCNIIYRTENKERFFLMLCYVMFSSFILRT